MVKNKLPRLKPRLSVATQNLLIQQNFPQFKFAFQNGSGVWRGSLQPSPISPVYEVLLKYNVGRLPKVWITNPTLNPEAPHRYKDLSLCLYWYKEWPWAYDRDISKTIIPWTAFWLYYYEIWLDTGEWLAKSAPHAPNQ